MFVGLAFKHLNIFYHFYVYYSFAIYNLAADPFVSLVHIEGPAGGPTRLMATSAWTALNLFFRTAWGSQPVLEIN
jgi:hypothetical protein